MRPSIVTLALAAFLTAAAAANAQEIVTLSTRPTVTQPYFLARVPKNPQAIAVLFSGGNGQIQLRTEDGRIKFAGGNFLVRVRAEFVNRNVITAIPDVPSDQTSAGMSDEFRLGEQHFTDISAVVADLRKRFPGLPVFLVGTSRGSVSAAAVGRAFGDGVTGIVLTSSMFLGARSGPGLSGFDYTKIKTPVLIVHHTEDGCFATPFREARKLAETRKYPLITVKGGKPATSGPCDPFSAHGFLGKESETVAAMVDWMLKKPYLADIE
ncbi:MAG: alpha/beta hydrolase [Betaproteobacteria bacterium]|nr:alpha/beta hydrolase [Betaproteobacteria bacterium]